MSYKGVEVYLRKTEVVKRWPKPLTPIDIASFLGLAGYYRRFGGVCFFYCFLTDSFDKEEGQV